MRNDARPVGEDAHERSPLDAGQSPEDPRESVTHDRQSPIVNRAAEDGSNISTTEDTVDAEEQFRKNRI